MSYLDDPLHSSPIPHPPRPPLFPYTTLFRSRTTRSLRSPARTRPQSEHSAACPSARSEEHTSELQSQFHFVCRLLLEKTKLLVVSMSAALSINPSTYILPLGLHPDC